MAKQSVNIDAQARQLIEDARAGVFNKIYLLMGDEPYYPELVCKAVIDNCIDESFRDFNQAVLYGSEVNAEEVVTQAREFPMMTERRLVVLKEAQLMKDIDKLSFYVENPLDTTVLVVVFHGASACSPIGMKKQFSTYIDSSCLFHEQISISAGQRGQQILLSARALIDFIHATTADITRTASSHL